MVTPEVVLKRFREVHGVESIETAIQLVIQNYLNPGLIGSYRRFRQGQTVNINGAWFYVAETKPCSAGGIVTANTIICCGPWLQDDHLPDDATLGAIAKAEGEKFGQQLREKQQRQEGAMMAAKSTSFYQQSMKSGRSFGIGPRAVDFVKWDEDYGDDHTKNDRIPLEIRNSKSQQALIQSIYTTPMGSHLRNLCLEFVQSFEPEEPILAVLAKTLKGLKDQKSADLALTDYRSYLAQHKQDAKLATSKELLETMEVYAYNLTDPTNDTDRYRITFGDIHDSSQIKYHRVDGQNVNSRNSDINNCRTNVLPPDPISSSPSEALRDDNISVPFLATDADQAIHAQYTTCQICLHDYELDDFIRILPCGHRMHQPCSDGWLRIKAVCPVARCSGLLQLAREQQRERDENP